MMQHRRHVTLFLIVTSPRCLYRLNALVEREMGFTTACGAFTMAWAGRESTFYMTALWRTGCKPFAWAMVATRLVWEQSLKRCELTSNSATVFVPRPGVMCSLPRPAVIGAVQPS